MAKGSDTENYKFKKPLEDDFYDINVFNDNMDAVDTALKGLEDGKVTKVAGKQLSTNDFMDEDKLSLGNLQISVGEINNNLDAKAEKPIVLNAIISTTWSGSAAPYTQEIAVTGILETDSPIIGVDLSEVLADAIAQQKAWGCISRIKTADNSIMVICNKKVPMVEIPIRIKVVR